MFNNREKWKECNNEITSDKYVEKKEDLVENAKLIKQKKSRKK